MSIQFWFVCKYKECRGYFPNVNSFIEHKKDKHSSEFQIINCFVFDEREKPLFPISQDENCTSSGLLKFHVNNEEFQHDTAAVKIKTEPFTQVEPEIILPDPLATTTIGPQLLETHFQTNNSTSHLHYDAGTELSAFGQQHSRHYNYHVASQSQHSNFDAFIDADVNPQSNFTDAAHYYSNNTDHISNFSVVETRTAIPADSDDLNEAYLEILPKTEVIVFENESDNAENETKITEIKDNAKNGIKIVNNPTVRLKRLTAEEIQSASFLKYRHIETDRSAKNHTYPMSMSKEVQPFSICNLCCKMCGSVRSLKLHLNECSNLHTNRDSFCVVCNKLLTNPVKFEEHCLKVHWLSPKEFHLRTRYRCQLCAKDFNEFVDLSSHTCNYRAGRQKIPIKCTDRLPCRVRMALRVKMPFKI